MARFIPYFGSLKAPPTFTKDYDEARRYEFRSFGHILVFLALFGLGSGHTGAALVTGLIVGLISLLRGYIPARSSDEWRAGEIEDDSPNVAVRAFAFTIPVFVVLLIVGFGLSLAAFIMETKLFMVGLVGMLTTSITFFLLLRKD